MFLFNSSKNNDEIIIDDIFGSISPQGNRDDGPTYEEIEAQRQGRIESQRQAQIEAQRQARIEAQRQAQLEKVNDDIDDDDDDDDDDELFFDVRENPIDQEIVNRLNSEISSLKQKTVNYLDDCDDITCGTQDNIYKNEEYKLDSDAPIFNMDFLENISQKINFLEGNHYVIKNNELSDNLEIVFIGDFHSSLHSFLQTIETLISNNTLSSDFIVNSNKMVIFCGDLIDRGPYGIEILMLLFLLVRLNDKGKILFIQGNHETPESYNKYGFISEIMNCKGSHESKKKILSILQNLPLAFFAKSPSYPKYYQFCHGGFSSSMVKDNNEIQKFLKNGLQVCKIVDHYGFLWSDFTAANTDLNGNMSSRGESIKVFGINSISNILEKNKIMCVLSGHQDSTAIGVVPNQSYYLKNQSEFENKFKVDNIYNGRRGNEKLYTPKNNITILNSNNIGAVTLSSATISKGLALAKQNNLTRERALNLVSLFKYISIGIVDFKNNLQLHKIELNYDVIL